ncbi:MAG: lipocalin family protein [Bacteroidota bacterium]
MKLQKITFLLVGLLAITFTTQAQSKKYVGSWQLTSAPTTNKCALDQEIILRKDGTATYHYGKNAEGCKAQTQEFKTWTVEQREFKMRERKNGKRVEKKVKKTVLSIGRNDSIMFIVHKKKGKTMKVTADMVSGDTTKEAMITFKKQ